MNYFGLFGSDDGEPAAAKLGLDAVAKFASQSPGNQRQKSIDSDYEEGEIMDDDEDMVDYMDADSASINGDENGVKDELQLNQASNADVSIDPKLCAICQENEPKYKCPACCMRTCSLKCVNFHKDQFDCDGKRDPIPFKKLEHFDDKQLTHDYFFLEDGSRMLDSLIKDRKNIVKSMEQLPSWLKKLLYEARVRGTRLRILPAGFTKRCKNKTTFMYDKKEIRWDIELLFTHVMVKGSLQEKPCSVVINRVPEKKTLLEVIDKWINPDNVMENVEVWKKFEPYRKSDKSFLRAHLFSGKEFVEVNLEETITKILEGKTIVEYPTFLVTLEEKPNLLA